MARRPRASTPSLCGLGLALLLGLTACKEEGSNDPDPYPVPRPGRIPGATSVPTPAGSVGVADGNLLVEREDLQVDTRLGPIRIGQTFNTADASWSDWLDLRYDGRTLVDRDGTRWSARDLEASSWVYVDPRTLRSRGGRIYRFEGGRLARIEAPFPDAPLLELQRDGLGRLVRILQHPPRPLPAEVPLEIQYEGSSVRLQSYGRSVQRVLDPEGRVRHVRDPAAVESGREGTRYLYDAQGDLDGIVSPTGTVTRLAYDEAGRVAAVARSSESGLELHWFTYRVRKSARGRFSLLYVDPTGSTAEYRHDGSGRVRWHKDPEGGIWRSGYRSGRRIWSENPLGERWSFEYVDGDLVARTDPSGLRESWERERGGWNGEDESETPWRRRVDAAGHVWTRQFDAYGRVTASTDPTGARHEFEYSGAAIRTVRGPAGFPTCFTYDAPYGRATRVDPGCRDAPAILLRDRAGRPLEDVGGGWRLFDGSGRLREILYPGGTSEEPYRYLFERDGAGGLVASESPYGSRSEIDRDSAGRIAAVRERVRFPDEDGSELWIEERIERDRAGRLIRRLRPDGTRVELVRDRNGRVTGLRYLDPAGTVSAEVRLERDAAGRTVGIDDSREPGPTEIERDGRGRPRTIRYPRGEWIVQQVGPSGKLVQLELFMPDGSLLRRFDWTRDAVGRPTALFEDGRRLVEATYGSTATNLHWVTGVRHERVFDGMERLTQVTIQDAAGTWIRHFELDYWKEGLTPTTHLRRGIDLAGTGEDFTVVYDEGGRIEAWHADRGESFRWDLVGNLLLRKSWGPRGEIDGFALDYDDIRRGLRWVGLDEVEHDLRGRVTRIGDVEIEWEPFDRPRRLGGIELRYSTLGTPISRTVDGERTELLFGGLVQADEALRPKLLEVEGIVVDLETGEHEYLHRNFRNDVAWVTDDQGSLIAVRRFGPFGTRKLEGHTRSLRGFAGGEELGEFVLLGERVYSPKAGRFLSRDPIPNRIHRYVYAHGDPVNYWDPDGLERRHRKALVELEVAVRPVPAARLRVALEEIVVDESDEEGAGERAVPQGPESDLGGPAPGPPHFPEVPNTPTIPDLTLPPRFGTCDGISAEPSKLPRLLALVPFAVLLARRGTRRRMRPPWRR